MHAVLVSHTGDSSGSNAIVLALLSHRPPDVVPACVFLKDGPTVAAARALGADARVVRAGRARELWRVPAVLAALARALRGTDVVLAHTAKAHVYASPAAALTRTPSLWLQLEVPGLSAGLPGMGARLQEVAARLPAQAVICPSDFAAARHRQRWPHARVERVYPGTATRGLQVRRHSPRAVEVVVVGRLLRWRHVERALRAMPAVIADEPEVRLTIVGAARGDVDADYPRELRALTGELGVEHAVTFAGAVDEWADRIGAADVLLHVSDPEPFSAVVVAALARGVPVIAPLAGGAGEAVRHGIDGLLVDPTDTAAVAKAVVELARDPDHRAAMGAAGRRSVEERFDERRMAMDIWRLLAEASKRPRAAR